MIITKEHIESINKDEAEVLYKYLGNKARGGHNNSKGNSLENFFTVYQVAKLFNNEVNRDETFYTSQVKCFIDDLVIEQKDINTFHYYQIKDVQVLTWESGKHFIADDFLLQHKICEDQDVKLTLGLVISDNKLSQELIKSIPERIEGKVNVSWFPTASSVSKLLKSNSDFKEEIVKMCAFENPPLNKIETLATIILGAWDSTDKQNIQLEHLLDICYDQNPNYIKGFSNKISKGLKSIFNSIESFNFEIYNGFIAWKYGEQDNGTVPYVIGSSRFELWENEVLNNEINTFEDLEKHLA